MLPMSTIYTSTFNDIPYNIYYNYNPNYNNYTTSSNFKYTTTNNTYPNRNNYNFDKHAYDTISYNSTLSW